jgi:TonB family protein
MPFLCTKIEIMKLLQFILFGLLMSSTVWAGNNDQSLNAVIGDESYVHKFGEAPGADATEQIRIQTHLEYVEQLLRSKSVTHLTTEQLKNRTRMIELLNEYRIAAEFPANYDYPDERKPCFLDKTGNICAVGYLVQQTAGMELVNTINTDYQYGYITEMEVPELTAWVSNSGLSLEECAIIQPTYDHMKRVPEPIVEPIEPKEIVVNDTFDVVEKMPEPIGGMEAVMDTLRDNLKAAEECKSGRVFVRFIVDTSGNVLRPNIVRGYCEQNDKQALLAVKNLKFKPGEQRGRKVHVRYILPIRFELN